VILAFLLIGYKCIREASTELCFSTVDDFVRCSNFTLEKLIGGKFCEVATDLAIHGLLCFFFFFFYFLSWFSLLVTYIFVLSLPVQHSLVIAKLSDDFKSL
jgi:hypothetical protein